MPVSGFPVSGNTVSGDDESHGRDVECNVCCGGGAQCETPPCVPCEFGVVNVPTPTANAVEFTTSGFTDGGTKATLFNGTWKLCHTGFCGWQNADSQRNFYLAFSQADYPANWSLRLEDNPTFGAGCRVSYKLTGPFNPFGTNVFTDPTWQTSGSCGPGSSYPATITVDPWGSATFCGCCYPLWPPPSPLIWSATFPTGIFNNCTLTYDATTFSWKGTSTYGAGSFCPGDPFSIEFFCVGGHWRVKGNFIGGSPDCDSLAQAETSCDPFLVENLNMICETCYSGTAAITGQVSQ